MSDVRFCQFVIVSSAAMVAIWAAQGQALMAMANVAVATIAFGFLCVLRRRGR